jgi:dipeptidyl aminopeptidase/acylaminoacyl peptidase
VRRMARAVWAVVVMLGILTAPVWGQRKAVLGQIDEPHPYYYRELYLPQLTSGPSWLSWGPGSDELVYSMAGSLWRQKLDGTEAVELAQGAGYDYQPDWAPDGTSLVYVSYQKDAMELWLLDLATGNTKQLTSGGAVNLEPRWSPDGKKIVWVSTAFHKRFHVFMAEVNGGKLGKRGEADRRNQEFPAPVLLQRLRHGNQSGLDAGRKGDSVCVKPRAHLRNRRILADGGKTGSSGAGDSL